MDTKIVFRAWEQDQQIAHEILIVEQKAVMPHFWNGAAEHEKLSAQQRNWNHQKVSLHNDQLAEYDNLQKEWDARLELLKTSVAAGKQMESKIKSIHNSIRLKPSANLKDKIAGLQQDIEDEKEKWCSLANCRKEIDSHIQELK